MDDKLDPVQDPSEQTNGQDMEELEHEDALVADSFKSLPEVQVPAGFLPNVMYQVYEYHHREKVNIKLVLLVSLIFLFASAAFFSWDVYDEMQAKNLSSFGQALSQKKDLILANFDNILSAIIGVLSATWQIVTGVLGLFFRETHLLVQIIVLAAIVSLFVFTKRWLSGISR